MRIDIPQYKTFDLRYLVLDYNGTIAVDGTVKETVKDRLLQLSEQMEIYVLTADTHGTAAKMCEGLPLKIKTFPKGGALEAKLATVQKLGAEKCVAVGNGRNDRFMCRESALSIAVLEQEGMCSALLKETDVCVKCIEDALDLLNSPNRLIATLRG